MSAGHNNRRLTPSAVGRVAQLETLAKKDYAAIDTSWRLALGPLGGGNHFIGLATDAAGIVWLTVQSGWRVGLRCDVDPAALRAVRLFVDPRSLRWVWL